MKASNKFLSGFTAFALLCLASWSVQAEPDKPKPDKPCKGKDCAKAIGPMNAPNAARVNKSVSATKNTVSDGGLRSNKSPGSNKLLPAVKPVVGNGVGNNALKNSAAAKSAVPSNGADGKIISPMFDKK